MANSGTDGVGKDDTQHLSPSALHKFKACFSWAFKIYEKTKLKLKTTTLSSKRKVVVIQGFIPALNSHNKVLETIAKLLWEGILQVSPMCKAVHGTKMVVLMDHHVYDGHPILHSRIRLYNLTLNEC
jgi:hypothetical protein